MGHIPNIDALISDIHTLRIQYEYTQMYTQKQCVGVAIEGIDIWWCISYTVYGLYRFLYVGSEPY